MEMNSSGHFSRRLETVLVKAELVKGQDHYRITWFMADCSVSLSLKGVERH